MCTVSVIPLPAGYRLVVNRDESRDRADALPPQWRQVRAARAIFPVDPVGGGTWAAATSSGLALCLLNYNPLPAPTLPDPARLISRGRIILSVLDAGDADGVLELIRRQDLEAFAPFRLVAIDPPRAGRPLNGPVSGIEVAWDRELLATRRLGDAPFCLASSGLGDAIVTPRMALFEEMMGGVGGVGGVGGSEAQDRFHRHVWPDRPEISVLMSRREARTVSVLSVEVRAGDSPASDARVQMRYDPVPEPLPVTADADALAG